MSDKNQHSYSSGRIRRAAGEQPPVTGGAPAAPPPASAPPPQPPSVFDFGQPAPPIGQGAPGSLFDFDAGPVPRQPIGSAPPSVFDYEGAAGVESPSPSQSPSPGGRSPGYSEQYLAGAPRQSAPSAVFNYDRDNSTAEAAKRARPSNMQQQHINLQAPSRAQGVPLAPGQGVPPPPLPKGPGNVFAAMEDPGPKSWEDEYLPPAKGKSKQAKGRAAAPKAASPKAKGSRGRKVLAIVAVLLCFCIAGVFAASHYFGELLDPGAFGRIISNLDVPRAYSKKDVIHLLIVGIDYEDGRDYGEGLGLTDMILYCRYDIKNNQLNMLQIPRDSYVGEKLPTGGTGKINALLISGDDKTNPINNLAGPFQTMFQLPVDNYIALDMDALKTIVDTFGGIRVFVPKDMEYGGSYLAQGWQWLDGNAAEFFVRNRKGEGFSRGDIDRLDNQRHFYSALFRRLLNLTPKDVKNLLPVFDHYCNTDLSLSDMIGLGVAALNLQAENVIFAKVPGATGEGLDPTGAGRSMYIVDKFGRGTPEDPGLANLLDQYFRGEGESVPAEQLELPDIRIPDGYALYPPNVQGMAEVQDPEGGSDVAVEPGAV